MFVMSVENGVIVILENVENVAYLHTVIFVLLENKKFDFFCGNHSN